MKSYRLGSVLDHVLVQDLKSIVARDRATTAEMLAHIAEVDARKLYAPEGYRSMHAWCVGALKMSEDEASRRVGVARVACACPAIFPALADGRLHMTAVLLLAPHLTRDNAGELLAAAAGQTRAAIELLIATRFPRPDVPTWLGPIAQTGSSSALARTTGESMNLPAPEPPADSSALARITAEARVPCTELGSSAPARTNESPAVPTMPAAPAHSSAPARMHSGATWPRIKPLAADRDAFQCTFRRETSELLRYAQALLGHSIASGDLAEVLHPCLSMAVEQLEKKKFGAGSRTRSNRASRDPRYIPTHVRREVLRRDGGRCTFVSDRGHRCDATRALEFDHEVSVARGGRSTAENLRLRCRAHNQLAAERAFGAGTMREKREAARAEQRRRRAARTEVTPPGLPA